MRQPHLDHQSQQMQIIRKHQSLHAVWILSTESLNSPTYRSSIDPANKLIIRDYMKRQKEYVIQTLHFLKSRVYT